MTSDGRSTLFGYITGIHKAKGCHLYRLNGVEDHIHIATHVHPSVALATLGKDIKLATSDFIKKESLFRNFAGWQDGYAAFTCSYKDKDALIKTRMLLSNISKNHEQHHKTLSFNEELIDLLNEHGIEFDEKYLL